MSKKFGNRVSAVVTRNLNQVENQSEQDSTPLFGPVWTVFRVPVHVSARGPMHCWHVSTATDIQHLRRMSLHLRITWLWTWKWRWKNLLRILLLKLWSKINLFCFIVSGGINQLKILISLNMYKCNVRNKFYVLQIFQAHK